MTGPAQSRKLVRVKSPWLPVVLPVVMLGLVASLMFLISRASGWSTLAETYPSQGDAPRPLVRLGYGVFRGWIGYNGGLVLAADERGLYISAMPIVLSFCHAPIFIPWQGLREIRVRKRWFGSLYELHTAQARDVDFALRPSSFAAIRPFAERAGVAGDYREA